MNKIIDTKYGIFIGQDEGKCIRISIPACTAYDQRSDNEFLDLPLMGYEEYTNLLECLYAMSQVFDKDA